MGDRQYSSFLIRCWHLEADVHRIKVEHIQSGQEAQVTTLAGAVEWIATHWEGASNQSAKHPGSAAMSAEEKGEDDEASAS